MKKGYLEKKFGMVSTWKKKKKKKKKKKRKTSKFVDAGYSNWNERDGMEKENTILQAKKDVETLILFEINLGETAETRENAKNSDSVCYRCQFAVTQIRN